MIRAVLMPSCGRPGRHSTYLKEKRLASPGAMSWMPGNFLISVKLLEWLGRWLSGLGGVVIGFGLAISALPAADRTSRGFAGEANRWVPALES